MKHMPKVMQDQLKKGSRSFSTSARSRMPEIEHSQPEGEASAAILASMIQGVEEQAAERIPGLKFAEPETPRGTLNFRKRYDTLQDQFTKMLMQDGKLARAQKVRHSLFIAFILSQTDLSSLEHVYHFGHSPHIISS